MVKTSYDPLRRLLGAVLIAVALSGCGNAIYAFKVNNASAKLEEARQLGAEELAPYEYYKAELHLKKARTEAAEADYGAAVSLADTSKELAIKAIKLSREARRGAGR